MHVGLLQLCHAQAGWLSLVWLEGSTPPHIAPLEDERSEYSVMASASEAALI